MSTITRTGAAAVPADTTPVPAARVTFEKITRRFGDVSAVHGVDLELAPGEILCLLGRSGCGKTTLLRIAAGLERQDSGRVMIDGEEVAGPNRFVPPEERGIGLMFQDYALFPHLTIAENVAFGLARLTRRQAGDHARAALARVGMEGFASAYPHTLSGGEQQRVALARAMAPRPRVLMMDEPFSGLDRSLRESVRDDTMKVLKESGASSILVTHDPEEAMAMADRIALMRSGKLVQVGTAHDLYRNPVDAEAARFFSEVVELRAPVASSEVATALGTFPAPGLADGTAAVVLIREHDLDLIEPAAGVPATVAAVRYVGEVTLVDLAIDDTGETVRTRRPGLPPLVPGDRVGLAVDPARAHIFTE